jgi:hypothetical protein
MRIDELIDIGLSRGYERVAGWVYHQIKADRKYGQKIALASLPKIKKRTRAKTPQSPGADE